MELTPEEQQAEARIDAHRQAVSREFDEHSVLRQAYTELITPHLVAIAKDRETAVRCAEEIISTLFGESAK